MNTSHEPKLNPVPEGYHSITRYLKLPNAGRLVEFLKNAFGGTETARLTKPDGTLLHAEVRIGDSLVMVHEAPGHWKPKPSTLYLYVGDVDATYQRAIEAGGLSVTEPANINQFISKWTFIGQHTESWVIGRRTEGPNLLGQTFQCLEVCDDFALQVFTTPQLLT